ncbi:erythrocyte membrane protein 1 [Plasmodium falciparum IGH-CR14]|uniref:Erythrocyte membrane protein 1 n=1 Tax=Plasmodium falciparum IGH-CR14 TaxID=580059 RepID=A0A0L1ICC7_PLAFA|nr:erythrocyte membrane protein 1 [Plasmodium falciparum IGH-CR14]
MKFLKENELYGTNNTKNTTFNSFSKQSHSDPIMNQLNLFHKWIDDIEICVKNDNDKIPLDNLGSTNISYNDITTITFFKQKIYSQIYL